ncbi:MFS family permease [Nakamurella sp. UYEF19]|uniref:MFS transporter n=1 Tax=Nakamurella sp. UYEF19 TaxID=1756392 RepID=UPI0033957B00
MAAYWGVLRTPHALRVFLPALLGRLSFGMVGLVVLLGIARDTGSYAYAGIATGLFGIANVLASPYRARWVDRRGQRLTLNLLASAYALSLCLMALLTGLAAPVWSLLVVATVIGVFPPPLSAAMRVLWGSMLSTPALRTRAYSLDAVAEEILYTLGPLIAAGIVTLGSPSAALVVTGVIALIGTFGLTSGSQSRAQVVHPQVATRADRPIRQPGFLSVLVAIAGAGIVIGIVEVAAPAFAQREGAPAMSGLLLAAFAAGSALGGLVLGHREWTTSPSTRLLVFGSMMAVLSGTLVLAPGLPALGFGLAVVGFFLAPSLVTGYLLADHLTSPAVRTEASSWINTAVNSGAAAASAVAGLLIDARSTGTAFTVGAIAAVICVAAAAPGLLGRNRMPTEDLSARPAAEDRESAR